MLTLVLGNILFYTIKDEELVNLTNSINTIDMIHDITNFEIVNEIEMDRTIIDSSLVLSSDDVLTQVNYLTIIFLILVNHYQIMFKFD